MKFLLWSNKHNQWWRPAGRGYTTLIEEAGRYSQDEAVDRVVQSAFSGRVDHATCMIVAPDDGGPTLNAMASAAAVAS